MKYVQYGKKMSSVKMTSNSKLDEYLLNIGYTPETVHYILNPPAQHSYHLMHDMDKMLEEIKGMNNKSVFTIVGDYDCGATRS